MTVVAGRSHDQRSHDVCDGDCDMLVAIVVVDGVFSSELTLLHDTFSVADVLRAKHAGIEDLSSPVSSRSSGPPLGWRSRPG